MLEAEDMKPKDDGKEVDEIIARATERAKTKNERLRHLKERNENYLAERKDDEDSDEDRTQEL